MLIVVQDAMGVVTPHAPQDVLQDVMGDVRIAAIRLVELGAIQRVYPVVAVRV